jgi:hypothetical protein
MFPKQFPSPCVETNLTGLADVTIDTTVFDNMPESPHKRKLLIKTIREATGFSLQYIALHLNQLPFVVCRSVDAVWAKSFADQCAAHGAVVWLHYHTDERGGL